MYALTLGLFCALALPCAITAASVPVSSGKDMALMPIKNGPVLRVDPDQNPDWAGEMNPLDCKRVRTLVGGRIAFYPPTEKFTFWSRIGRSVPPPGKEFELPFGFTYNDVLPLPRGGFDKTSKYPPEAPATFHDIINIMDWILNDVIVYKQPEWGYGLGRYGRLIVITYLPRKSNMARRWTVGMRSQWSLLGDLPRATGNVTQEVGSS
ncbi:MAG: hypothetical protein Q9228_002118 [Teloschistes exilis]